MHTAPEGRQVQVPRRWAAEKIAPWFGRSVTAKTIVKAEAFLVREELDVGIVVARGDDAKFWHLHFQEYLAGRAIAARPDEEQKKILFEDAERLFSTEWREAVLLFFGVLHHHGRKKVDDLLGELLTRMPVPAPGNLRERARVAGLIGEVIADLVPLEYRLEDRRYPELREGILGLFEAEPSKSVPVAIRLAAAEAIGRAGDPRLKGNLWVPIPGGPFLFGEGRPKEVTLPPFEIRRYPVTVAEYAEFVQANGYRKKAPWKAGGYGEVSEPRDWTAQLRHPTWPITGVGWYEAKAYCAWLGKGADLPSEEQWERAARGTDGREYPWGNERPTPEHMNYDDSHIGHPTPVGLYPLGASPEGVLDMAGNVWEWCETEHELEYEPGDRLRVFRGGCFFDSARSARSAYRSGARPGSRRGLLGFRPARSVTP
jgi:formylglycine-generating enzyme required for sulfatase activity